MKTVAGEGKKARNVGPPTLRGPHPSSSKNSTSCNWPKSTALCGQPRRPIPSWSSFTIEPSWWSLGSGGRRKMVGRHCRNTTPTHRHTDRPHVLPAQIWRPSPPHALKGYRPPPVPGTGRRSNRDTADDLAKQHTNRGLHRLTHASRTLPCKIRGYSSFAAAKTTREFRVRGLLCLAR